MIIVRYLDHHLNLGVGVQEFRVLFGLAVGRAVARAGCN